ncbi:desi-like protein at4g17486 [Phtheirospermum japonicum]|uniref:Desi-like protein at4g17486 n=1 Tax=Phtheirospermum japonicum TaxID=374723 RepID=A0A830D3W1_9LAMI|nr:desi-like protein at4g17486 [Phtheirospermum japonicum]
MLCRKSSVKSGRGSVPVHLNVYDLTSANGYAYWLGLGVYHSGVEDLSPGEVRILMEQLSNKYKGNAYNLISKNCNHFCNDASLKLTGDPIPNWVNRLARIGFLCKCIIPANLNTTKVGHHKMEDKVCETDKKKLKSHSCRFTNSSSNTSSSSLCSPPHVAANASRSSLPPSSPLV